MSDVTQYAPKWSRWWNVLLVASLALNLLVGGAIAARFFFPERIQRMAGLEFAQLLPRRFFMELPRDRRAELFAILKQYRDGFGKGRDGMRAEALKIADALEAEPYDPKAVEAAIQSFAAVGTGIVTQGTTVAMEIVSKLNPQERALLAQKLRERGRPRGKH